MSANIHALQQGGEEWHKFRAEHFGASEAAAMLGVSKYQTRTELLRIKATGITPEVASALQAVFDRGHETEIGGRAIAEEIIGEDLFPATYSDGKLSASCDGLTILGDTAFEHKQYNAKLFDAVTAGILPDSYQPQCQQVMLVTGAERLLFMVSDGTPGKCAHIWVYPDVAWQQKIISGWSVFENDIAQYQHVEEAPKVITGPVETLPSIFVSVEGRVTDSNLPAFVQSAREYIGRINTSLVTDADFDTAAKNVNELKSGEDRLEVVKANALAQTATIDELFRAIDTIKEEMRAKRLTLDKLVKAEKENRKTEIVSKAQEEYRIHFAGLVARVGVKFGVDGPTFAEAIKGLKSIDSMRDKVSAALANAKIEASAIADRIEANRKTVEDMSLFPDFAQVCAKAPEDFAALLAMRVAQRKEAEERRLEAERARIQAEERAKAERDAAAKIEAAKQEAVRLERERAEEERQKEWLEEQRAQLLADSEKRLAESSFTTGVCVPATGGPGENSAPPNTTREGEPAMPAGAGPEPAQPVSHIADAGKMVDDGATMKLGDISARLEFTVTADFLASLGFQHIRQDKNAKLYNARDFGRICQAIASHVMEVSAWDRRLAE